MHSFVTIKSVADLKEFVSPEVLSQVKDSPGKCLYIPTIDNQILCIHNAFLFRRDGALVTTTVKKHYCCDLCEKKIAQGAEAIMLSFKVKLDNWLFCKECGEQVRNSPDPNMEWRRMYEEKILNFHKNNPIYY